MSEPAQSTPELRAESWKLSAQARLAVSALFCLWAGLLQAQPARLPPCPEETWVAWDGCQGTLTFADGESYSGEFRRDKFHGRGVQTLANGQVYTGDFVGGQREGQGVITWPNGDRFSGGFRAGKRNGPGTFTWASGARFVGQYQDDTAQGVGTYATPSGERFVGEYRQGKRSGQGIEYRPDGSVNRSGLWEAGVLKSAFAIEPGRFPFGALESAGAPGTAPAIGSLIPSSAGSAASSRAELQRPAVQASLTSPPEEPSPAVAARPERRVALIIGNSAYKTHPLVNPAHDATDLDTALRGLGFKTTLLRDATIAQMRSATRLFAEDAASSDVALIFFAGHGIESKGRNFLVPVSADIKHEYELEDQAYDAGRWLEMLEGIRGSNRQRVNIVILDACRNNALARSWRSSGTGLARMDAPTGTFVAFATAPGKVALDGDRQRNSPFTKNLLRAIQTPDLPIELMFKEVRRLVLEETRNQQVPWDNSSLVGDFVFRRTR